MDSYVKLSWYIRKDGAMLDDLPSRWVNPLETASIEDPILKKELKQYLKAMLFVIPLPPFYFRENNLGQIVQLKKQLLLSALIAISKDKLRIPDLDPPFESLQGRWFSEMPNVYQNRIGNTWISLHTFTYDTPIEVVKEYSELFG